MMATAATTASNSTREKPRSASDSLDVFFIVVIFYDIYYNSAILFCDNYGTYPKSLAVNRLPGRISDFQLSNPTKPTDLMKLEEGDRLSSFYAKLRDGGILRPPAAQISSIH
jgi:hypothetical protein